MNVDTRARQAATDVLAAVDVMRRSPAGIESRAGSIEGFRTFEARRRRTQRAVAVVVAVAIAALGFAGLLRAFRSAPVPANKITPDNVNRLEVAWRGSIPRADGAVVGEGYVVAYAYPTDNISGFLEDCASRGGDCAPLWTADVTVGEDGTLSSTPVISDGHVLVGGERCGPTGELKEGECASELYSFPLDCRTDGQECPPRWVAPKAGGVLMMGSVATDGTYVYASGNQLDVYRFDCGEAGATCEKAWTRPAGSFGPVLWEDTVIVAQDPGHLAAFDVDCRSNGGECEPLWRAKLRSYGEPVVADGIVYISDWGVVAAYPVDCGTQNTVCEPLWAETWAEDVWVAKPLVSDGILYVLADRFVPSDDVVCGSGSCVPLGTHVWTYHAYSVDCVAAGDPCQPLWTTETRERGLTPTQGHGQIDGAGSGRFYITVSDRSPGASARLLVFDSRCRTDGGACTPDWTAPIATSESTLLVGHDLVFISEGREVLAYAADCGTSGETCEPIWRAPLPAGTTELVIDGDKLLFGSKEDGLTVFATDGEVTSEEGGG